MSTLLNQPLCATAFGNTGFGDCILEPGKIIGAIQVPSTFQIAPGDVGTLQTFLQNKAYAAIGTRIFPYHNFVSVTDNTEDVSITTTDYGSKYITRDGFYDFTFRYFSGGVLLHQDIQKNAGSGKYFIFYDDNGNIFARKGKSGSTTVLKGIPVDIFYVKPWRPDTGADKAVYELRFIINPIYMNKGNFGYYSIGSDFSMIDIVGVQELELVLDSLLSNVAKVSVYTKISKVNLHPVYGAALANTGYWKATKRSDGTTISFTVAEDGANHDYTFTFNSGTVSGMAVTDAIYLQSQNASVLNAAGIPYEAHDGLYIELPGS
jgi:hypothetical protein